MKIAFIGQKGIPAQQGGVEKHVQELSIRLAKMGHEVSVYCRPHYTGKKINYYQGVKIINLPSLNTKHFDAISHTFLASFHALFQKYDLIHYHSVGPSLFAWLPRICKPKTKVVVTFHCLDRQHQKWGAIARLILNLSEWSACYFPHQTIVVSKALQKYCQQKLKKQTKYIPNGVSIKKIENRELILKKFNLEKEGYFLTASRLVRHKGIHTTIKAYQKIKTDKKLVIAGTGSNTNDYVSYLKELAANNPNIIFVGQQTGEELKALYQNAYLFIQPSETEGLSIALLEAISLSAPVLVSDIEENLEIVEKFGLKFANKDIDDLKTKIELAISEPKLIKILAAEAYHKISRQYCWDDIAKQTIDLYKKLINGDFKCHGEKLDQAKQGVK